MGMTNEERKKHIRIANMLIGVINDLERPMLMTQTEKDVAKEALENYVKMLEQQPCGDWYDVSSDELTLEQARQAVKDLRKKLAEEHTKYNIYGGFESCDECANEHRQLAEWLRELKAYIKIISELSEALHFYDGCEKCQGFREYPTSDFVNDVRSWVKQFEEVNTDV